MERLRQYKRVNRKARPEMPTDVMRADAETGDFKRLYATGIKRLAETPSKAELDYLRGIRNGN